jgi:hypothetical protein
MDTKQKIDSWIPLKEGHKTIAVAGVSQGSLVALIPLYDLRDGNLDGKVDFGERLGNFFSGNLAVQTQGAYLLKKAAVEIGDPIADQYANRQLLGAAYSYAKKQLNSIYVGSLVGSGVGQMVKGSVSPLVGYFVKKGAEELVSSALSGK